MNRSSLPGLLGLVALCGASSVACSNTAYRSSLNAAEVRLAEARERGAETDAPYEYYFARVELSRAQAEGSAEEAASAERLAQKAVDTVRAAAHEGRSASAPADAN